MRNGRQTRSPRSLGVLPLAWLLLVGSAPAGAQQPAAAQAPSVRAAGEQLAAAVSEAGEAQVEVTDEDIETFAEIHVELQRTARRYERKIAAAESEREAQEIQARLQKDSLETLERHGWTAEKFERVIAALNRRPDLLEKAMRLIEKKS